MENRNNLRTIGLVLMILVAVNFVLFVVDAVLLFQDGGLKVIDAATQGAVKVGAWIVLALQVVLMIAQFAIGYKGYKVSREPNADKGYITAAKVFFVLDAIVAVSALLSFFGSDVNVADSVMNLVSVALDLIIYGMFIKAANSVRQSVLDEAK